jgi:hypothetical protein
MSFLGGILLVFELSTLHSKTEILLLEPYLQLCFFGLMVLLFAQASMGHDPSVLPFPQPGGKYHLM